MIDHHAAIEIAQNARVPKRAAVESTPDSIATETNDRTVHQGVDTRSVKSKEMKGLPLR